MGTEELRSLWLVWGLRLRTPARLVVPCSLGWVEEYEVMFPHSRRRCSKYTHSMEKKNKAFLCHTSENSVPPQDQETLVRAA